jgi:type VI secretion system secreted protein VgrG
VDPTLREKPVRTFGGGGDGDGSAGEVFRLFRGARRTRPASVEVDDHDYGSPTLVAPERKTVSRDGLGRVRIFGERAVTPAYMAPTAARRAALWSGGAETFEAAGDVGGLRAGFSFGVEEHPREAMNGELLALRVEHEGATSTLTGALARRFGLRTAGGRDGRLYEARVQATRTGSAWHPPLRAPRPRATGLERAVVDGPAGHHYAQIDDAGRYRVRFDFDEGDGAAGKASVAVRMMQMHAGNPEGMHFPLRKGTAVMVAFLGGDPDRPTIVGAVPDAHRPSPVTSANGTLNVIHTGSDTRLEIEDQKGSQSIALSTPPMTTRWHMGKPHSSSFQGTFTHHFVETTDGDCLFDFGGDQDVNVGAKLWEIVEDSVLEIYKTSLTTEITGPQTTHVTGPVIELYGATQTTEVTKLTKETYDAIQLTAVAGPRDETYAGGHQNETKSFVVELYAGAQTKGVSGKVTENYNGPLIQAVGGSTSQTFAAPVTTDFAPTVWIQDSVSFDVAGAITVTTPSWVEIATVQMSNDAVADAVATTSTTVGTIKTAITLVLKAEQVGILGEVTGLKAELTGPNILAALMHVEITPLAFETRAAGKVYKSGFRKIN